MSVAGRTSPPTPRFHGLYYSPKISLRTAKPSRVGNPSHFQLRPSAAMGQAERGKALHAPLFSGLCERGEQPGGDIKYVLRAYPVFCNHAQPIGR